MLTISQKIAVAKTLDVEVVERELAELWKQTAGQTQSDDEEALMRSRVANLMIIVSDSSEVAAIRETLGELSAIHPYRAFIMVSEKNAPDRDIEMYVSAFCQGGKSSGARSLCCEEVTLTACGQFVSELPSATIPLLVPDLPVFLWWVDEPRLGDKLFIKLNQAADRLVIDSAEFDNPPSDVSALAQLFKKEEHEHTAISDINWARLTSWRALLAGFYDIRHYRRELDVLDQVQIDYVVSPSKSEAYAPQALLIAGWLASQLGWNLAVDGPTQETNTGAFFKFSKGDRSIALELNRVRRPEMKTGRLARVELKSLREQPAAFVVRRSVDGLHLETEAQIGKNVYPGRVLPVRNRSTAQLLGREMEILCEDRIYEAAINLAAIMVGTTQK